MAVSYTHLDVYKRQVFIYDEIVDSDIFPLTGVKVAELFEAAASEQ